jgi:hypothetical protein
MSAPYARTVITASDALPAGNDTRTAIADRRPIVAAGLGAACISASGILVKLADTGTATTAFYRCFLALPVLLTLAVLEQRRHGRRQLAPRLGAVLAGGFLAVDLVLWNHTIAEVGGWGRHRDREPAGALRRPRRLAAVPGARRTRCSVR